jgi:dephospho-CoA kinase
VAAVLVTGMSGTGKSTVLDELARRGHRVVDTDHDGWIVEVPQPGGGTEPLWDEVRMRAMLTEPRPADEHLFVAGCVANQGRFYPEFRAVVLLSVPLDVLLERIAGRDTNDFGKSAAERDKIIADTAAFEPLLRAGATDEIDTRQPLAAVADQLERLAHAAPGPRESG